MSIELPNLAGVATDDLVQQVGGGSYAANYINWSRTMHLLRVHAPGWMPEMVETREGDVLHRSPAGGYLLMRFRHVDGHVTPAIPQAIMDNRNNAIPYEKIDSRDVTDTHRRGFCMAAAMTFGLAYELWAKMPLESGFADKAPEKQEPTKREVAKPAAKTKGQAGNDLLKTMVAKLVDGKAEDVKPAGIKLFGLLIEGYKSGSKVEVADTENAIQLARVLVEVQKWANVKNLDRSIELLNVAKLAVMVGHEGYVLSTEEADTIIDYMHNRPFEPNSTEETK